MKKAGQYVCVSVQLPKEHLEYIDRLRKETGATRSAVIRMVVEHWVEWDKETQCVERDKASTE